MTAVPVLSDLQRAFLVSARRAVLVTIAQDGRPRPVPICFVLDPGHPIAYSPLDEKPKRTFDPRGLARVRDLVRDPRVTLLVDRWNEDWTRLAWLRCHGRASLLEPAGGGDDEHRTAVAALRRKYSQYEAHDLAARPIIRIDLDRAVSWGALEPA
jgi:PPOX class probable F420-dependent enzyme